MLSESTRKRIKERKMLKHSNPSQFLKRVKHECNEDIKDLTLVAKNFEEKHLEEIFTDKSLLPLIRALLEPRSKRVLNINELLTRLVANKLMHELPNSIGNNMGIDIQRIITYAELLTEYYDKPLVRKK